MKNVLLLGAGFSCNWGGWTASPVVAGSDPELNIAKATKAHIAASRKHMIAVAGRSVMPLTRWGEAKQSQPLTSRKARRSVHRSGRCRFAYGSAVVIALFRKLVRSSNAFHPSLIAVAL
jgi:hypothetical protein